VMAVQDLLKRRWGLKNNLCFSSGLTAQQAADFVLNSSGLIVEDDFKFFDSSISAEWCYLENKLFKRFGAPRAVRMLLSANVQTHGVTTHGWRYRVLGTRKSGDPFTSLMNSIINALSHLFVVYDQTGCSLAELKEGVRMIVQGDDNVLIHRHPEPIDFVGCMERLGFTSEAVYRKDHYDVEFCSCRLYHVRSGGCFGPKPGRVLAKFGYLLDKPAVPAKALLRGISKGLRVTAGFLAPIRAVCDRVDELTSGVAAIEVSRKFLPFAVGATAVGDVETMVDLNMSYDWDYGKQTEFERQLGKMQFGDKLSGIAELLLDFDCGGGRAYPFTVLPFEFVGTWLF